MAGKEEWLKNAPGCPVLYARMGMSLSSGERKNYGSKQLKIHREGFWTVPGFFVLDGFRESLRKVAYLGALALKP
jgi:hypothetical protein